MQTTAILTPADHDHFLEHGYVVVKHVAPPDAIAQALAGFEGKAYSGTVGAADYKPVSPESLPRCYGPRFAAAISELFGEPYNVGPKFAGTHMPRVYEPAKEPEWKISGGHIDDDYPTAMPAGWALGCFLFLTPVKARGGGFVYFPGSYRRIRAAMTHTPGAVIKDSGDGGVIGEGVEFFAEPGDALFFHHMMGHAGSTNVADTTTRHALLSRHHPRARLVPGSKPFAEMSTIEKASSVRYLRQRFGSEFAMPTLNSGVKTSDALRAGIACGPAAVPFHFAGRAWLFMATGRKIRVVSSDDFFDWREETAIEAGGPVVDLAIYQRERTVYLAVGDPTGVNVLASADLRSWRSVATLPGAADLCGHYATDYGSKLPRGYFIFTRSHKSAPNTLAVRYAPQFEAALTSDQSAVAYELTAPDARLAGFMVSPTYGESEFALVLDLAVGDALSRPHFVKGSDSVLYKGEPTPIAFTGETPPRNIRVYQRARNYWLVTFIRTTAGVDQLSWGVIDWSAPVALTPVTDAFALNSALETVGLL